MDLIVEGKGLFVGKHQGRVRVYREKKMLQEAPLLHLKQIVIVDSGVGVSSDVVQACSEEGIPLHFMSKTGHNTAGLYTAGLVGTVLTRRAQLLAYTQPQSVAISMAFVAGKLENQVNLVRYFAKSRKEEDERELYQSMQLIIDELRDSIQELEHLALCPSG